VQKLTGNGSAAPSALRDPRGGVTADPSAICFEPCPQPADSRRPGAPTRCPAATSCATLTARPWPYVYSRANEAEAMQAKVLTEDEARRVAAQSEFAKNKPLATLDGHRHNSGPHRVFTSRYPRSEPCRMAQRQ
jgi:hypothetical protein